MSIRLQRIDWPNVLRKAGKTGNVQFSLLDLRGGACDAWVERWGGTDWWWWQLTHPSGLSNGTRQPSLITVITINETVTSRCYTICPAACSAKEINQTRQGIKSKKITKTIKRTGNGIAPSVLPPVASKPDWIAPSISAPSTSPPRIMANPSTASNSTTTAVKKLEKLKRRQLSKLTASANAAAAARSKTNGLSKSEKEKSKAALLSVPLR